MTAQTKPQGAGWMRCKASGLRRILAVLAVTAMTAACAYPYGSYSNYSAPPPPAGDTAYGAQPAWMKSEPRTASLSYGAIKQALRVGVSTQEEVLSRFGSPNNMTLNAKGHEIWVYDLVRSEVDTSGSSANAGIKAGFGVGLGNAGAGALFGGGESHSRSRLVSATKTLTIILEFDRNHVLTDLLAREGRY